nr:mechanosensitive ion channel domain-containing protein [Chthonobacter rhizosphaerae]
MVIWIAATSWIEYRLNPASGRVSTARARTLFSLFRNAFSILLVVITTMLALSELGVDIAPLIAGAGVLGLAVGFGSQKLVQDIITGAFIQFENAMNEGDVVTVFNISGVVERLTIRSVGLRDVNGVYHVIPFSSVDSVSNAMRGFAFHVADVSVAYKENIPEVKRLMGVAFERLMATPHGAHILEPLEMNGVMQLTDNAVVIRGRIKTVPGQQWGVGRAYTEFVKEVFDENGVEIPFPQQTVWFGHPKGSGEPDLRVLAEDTGRDGSERPARSPRPRRRKPTPLDTVDVPDSPRKRDEDAEDEADDMAHR